MGSGRPCSSALLASGRTCRVARCSHGTVHLTLGALTLRVTPEQLRDLAATFSEAATLLGPAAEERPADRMLC